MKRIFSVLLLAGIVALIPGLTQAGMDAEGAGAAIAEADSEMGEFSREAEQESQVESLDAKAPDGEALITDDAE